MRRLFLLAALACSLPALAETFDAANKYLQERSYSRACEAFTAWLKANPGDPLAREGAAKKAASCVRAGKGSYDELRKLATEGEKDFARAVALQTLVERGEQNFDAVAPLLKQAMGESGRRGTEARQMLESSLIREMDNNSWNAQRIDKLAELGLSLGSSDELQAAYRFRRARARLNNGQKLKEAEAELREVGNGKTDVADDALYALAERRENESKFVEALEVFDEIVKRFSPTTSNMRSSAESRAASIRRPYVSISVPNNFLPGVKPEVSVSFRNVKNAAWTLKRADPIALPAGAWPSEPQQFSGAQLKQWNTTLKEPSRYAPGSLTFDLEATEPGLYVIEVNADGQTAATWALISQQVVVAKTDRTQVLVSVFDVETGEAQADAEVALFTYSSPHQKLTGKTNASGIATFKTEKTNDSMVVWTRKGPHIAWSSAGGSYWQNYNREHLAYVMTDRPLYKPGETVGLKLFLRSREGGPSTPLSGTKAWVRVTDPTGKELIRQALTTNQFGTASFSLPIDKKATLGAFNISVEGEGQYFTQTQSQFRVEEYKPPEYIVSVEPLGNPKPGEKVKFKVKANFYSGGPVANATGRALVTVKGWQHQFGPWPDDPTAKDDDDGYGGYDYDDDYSYKRRRGYYGWYGQYAQHTLQFKTGKDGTAEVEAPAYENGGGQPLEYAVQVFVTDASRREIQGGGSIKLSPQAFFVDLKTDHLIYRPGERVTVRLRAEDANSRPADPDVVLRLMRLSETGASKIAETRTRLSKGVGRAVLDADAIGQVRVEVLDGTQPGDVVLATTDLWLTSDTKPIVPGPGFNLVVDKSPLKVGDNLRVLVAGNRAGGHVLLTLESDVIAAVQMVELKGRARFVEFKLPADVSPNGWLHAYRFEDVQMQQRQLPFKVRGSEVEIGVDVDFGRASAEPGSAVTATVKTKGATAGLALETALTVVDESLFAIAPERKDFLSFFGRTQRQQRVTTYSSYNQRYHRPRPVPVAKTPVTVPADKRPDTAAAPKTEEAERKQVLAEAAPAPPASRAAMGASADMDDSLAGAGFAQKPMEKAKKDSAKEAPMGRDEGGGAEEPIKVRADFSTSAGWYAALASRSGAPLSQSLKLKDSLTSWKAVATVVSEGANLGQGSAQIKTAKALMCASRRRASSSKVTRSCCQR